MPAFLGGDCTCSKCESILSNRSSSRMAEIRSRSSASFLEDEPDDIDYPTCQLDFTDNCNYVLRTTIVAVLMICVLVAFIAGMDDPESLPSQT